MSGTINDKHVDEVGKANQSEEKDPVEPNIYNSEIGEKDDTEAQDDETDKLEEEEPLEINNPDSKINGSHGNTRIYDEKVSDEEECNVDIT